MDAEITLLLRLAKNVRLFKERQPAKYKTKSAKTPIAQRKGSWANARMLHRRLVFRINKYCPGDQEMAALLKLLKSCKRKRPCCSAACPKCNYAAQGLWAELLREFMDVSKSLTACATIIARGYILPKNESGSMKVERFRKTLDTTFDKARVTLMVGAFDFEVSEFPDGRYKEHNRPHLHVCGQIDELQSAEKHIRARFYRKGSVHKPVDIRPFDGKDEWLWYTLKIPNNRKIHREEKKADGEGFNQLDSNYKPLRKEQHIQQAKLLHRLGWAGRFYLRGIELKKNELGRWRLVRV
jgi:hypothetical protein